MAHKSYFLHLHKPKNRLWWRREIDVSSDRQALKTKLLPLTNPKCDLKLKKRCFNGSHVFWTHFRPLDQPKMRLGEVDKRCFKVSHGTLNLFWTCGLAQNASKINSKKRCFQASNCILNLFSTSGLPENGIRWRRKSGDLSNRHSLGTLFFLLTNPKCNLGDVEKVKYQGVAWHF